MKKRSAELKTLSRYQTTDRKKKRNSDIVYVAVISVFFAAMAAAILFMPRSDESQLEQRKLAKFPEITVGAVLNGSFMDDVTLFFRDNVPMRDDLMVTAARLQEFTGFRSNDIKLHNVAIVEAEEIQIEPPVTETAAEPVTEVTAAAAAEAAAPPAADVSAVETAAPVTETTHVTEETEPPPEDDNVNILNNGIAVVGNRALMLYGGNFSVGEAYAQVIEKYKKALGDKVNVYCMVVPTSSEFYCPESISPYNASQLDNIENIYSHLSEDVVSVDAYSALQLHTNENIYFRTDHHWTSLGAYYAARAFAEAADVPFTELSTAEYDMRTVEGYVGTMYGYTQDIEIKNNPEDFVYYVPKNIDYKVTYYNYILGDGNAILGMSDPINADFFLDFSKSKSSLYCTFMGGDAKITHIHTSTGNGRRLAIFKDSYGNALPQFLFGSFEDIYIMDMRYFTYNAEDYLKEKGITDLLFANNTFHATTRSTVKYYERMLTQGRTPAVTTTVAPAAASTPVTSKAETQKTASGTFSEMAEKKTETSKVTEKAAETTTTVPAAEPPQTTTVPETSETVTETAEITENTEITE